MKNILRLISIAILIAGCDLNYVIKQGSLNFLKGETLLQVEYDYSDMKVGSSVSVEEYVRLLNSTTANSGTLWRNSFSSNKISLFEPKFEEMFNRVLQGNVIIKRDAKKAKYTMIFKVLQTSTNTQIEYDGIWRSRTHIWGEAVFVESSNRDNILATVYMGQGNPGEGVKGYYEEWSLVQSAYGCCGVRLAQFLLPWF